MLFKPYSILYSIVLALCLAGVALGISRWLGPTHSKKQGPDTYNVRHQYLIANWKSRYVLTVDTRDLELFVRLLPALKQFRGVTIVGSPCSGQRLLQVINKILVNPSVTYLAIQTPVTIPVGLKRCHTLEVLSLDQAKLTGVGQLHYLLPNLKVLSWTNAALEVCPMTVGKLYSLRKLDLTGNQLKRLPFSLGRYPNLRQLIVDNNPIVSLAPILRYKKLTNLSVKQLQLESSSMGTLTTSSQAVSLPYLHKVALNNNGLTALPEFLAHCPNLTDLDLSDNPFTEKLSGLCGLERLKVLRIANTGIQALSCLDTTVLVHHNSSTD